MYRETHWPLSTWSFLFFLLFQGTGSAGATVRIYIEQFEPDVSKHDVDAQIALKPLIGWFLFCFRRLKDVPVMTLVMTFISLSLLQILHCLYQS